MSTNLDLFKDALRLLNVINETETPTAEQGATCLRAMNQMLEQWEEDDIKLQYYEQSSTSATFPCPAYCEPGVIAALAIRLAPYFGASVSTELAALYDVGWSTICRKAMNSLLPEARMDHLPGPNGRRSDIINDP